MDKVICGVIKVIPDAMFKKLHSSQLIERLNAQGLNDCFAACR